MRYTIEYLTETADENSVCRTSLGHTNDLKAVGKQAWERAATVRRSHNATGFQIRDLNKAGEIVALQAFDAEGASG